jgi:3-hydroxy-3-methylglutaryl CoA synthase
MATGAGVLEFEALALARERIPSEIRGTLGVESRSVLAPWQDPVTLAVNAARRLITPENRARVRWLLVATESSVDQEKPMSSWVHRYLELPSTCRNLEVKHACYAGTGAMQLLLGWLMSQAGPEDLVLVVAADLSLLGLQTRHEFVLGAGSCAALLRRNPDLLEVDPQAGVYANEVTDVIRPTPWLETGNSETSLFAYLEGVDESFDAFELLHGPTDPTQAFALQLYHAPFPGITERAHRRLVQRAHPDWGHARCARDFELRVADSLSLQRQVGGVYAASTWLSLLSALVTSMVEPGDSVGVFSYGSGSCAEFYRGRIGAHPERVRDPRAELLSRRTLSVAEYEAMERQRSERRGTQSWQVAPLLEGLDWAPESGELQLIEVRDYKRIYGWAP